ncbi:MAG: hypothetical protein QHH07_09270 [Sedimentisphaerales bacterium]|nr:hypothetical protein [Sedimentisphaerales bacterium]
MRASRHMSRRSLIMTGMACLGLYLYVVASIYSEIGLLRQRIADQQVQLHQLAAKAGRITLLHRQLAAGGVRLDGRMDLAAQVRSTISRLGLADRTEALALGTAAKVGDRSKDTIEVVAKGIRFDQAVGLMQALAGGPVPLGIDAIQMQRAAQGTIELRLTVSGIQPLGGPIRASRQEDL